MPDRAMPLPASSHSNLTVPGLRHCQRKFKLVAGAYRAQKFRGANHHRIMPSAPAMAATTSSSSTAPGMIGLEGKCPAAVGMIGREMKRQ